MDSSLNISGVWAIENKEDNTVYIADAANINFAIMNIIRKLSYRDCTFPPLLIKHYWENKLVAKALEPCYNDILIRNVMKLNWINIYKDNNWNLYGKQVFRYFATIIPRKHISLEGEERYLVYVELRRKGNMQTVNPLTVGVFNTIKQAKDWCHWAYGSAYEKTAVTVVTMCSSALTKTTLQNPILQDKNLLNLYKKVYE